MHHDVEKKSFGTLQGRSLVYAHSSHWEATDACTIQTLRALISVLSCCTGGPGMNVSQARAPTTASFKKLLPG